jgi:hypothetical protein
MRCWSTIISSDDIITRIRRHMTSKQDDRDGLRLADSLCCTSRHDEQTSVFHSLQRRGCRLWDSNHLRCRAYRLGNGEPMQGVLAIVVVEYSHFCSCACDG